MKQTYSGKELRPFQGRPGAMDAYNLPSMVDGKRVKAGRIKAQLVGKEIPQIVGGASRARFGE
jgi:hypothetical protein